MAAGPLACASIDRNRFEIARKSLGKAAKKKLPQDLGDIRRAMGSYLLHRRAAGAGTAGIDGGCCAIPRSRINRNLMRYASLEHHLLIITSARSPAPWLKSGPQVRLAFNLPQSLAGWSLYCDLSPRPQALCLQRCGPPPSRRHDSSRSCLAVTVRRTAVFDLPGRCLKHEVHLAGCHRPREDRAALLSDDGLKTGHFLFLKNRRHGFPHPIFPA